MDNKEILKQIIEIKEKAQDLIDQAQKVVWELYFLEVRISKEDKLKDEKINVR